MPEIRSEDLVGDLYQQIRDMILDGVLAPGEKLVQEELAARLGVSRTPLMRALQLLEGDLLVESIPRRGMVVRKMSLRELRDAFLIRQSLESMCAGMAARNMTPGEKADLRAIFEDLGKDFAGIDLRLYQKADQKFHMSLLKQSGNSLLNELYVAENVLKLTYQFGLIRLPVQTFEEHMQILDAIDSGETESARKAMFAHLQASIEALEERITSIV